MGGLAVKVTGGPSGHTNSPRPSSREGHHSTARWSSGFLLLELMLHGFHVAAAARAARHRNRYRRRIAKPKSRPIFCAIASLIQTMAIGSR